MNKKTLLSVIAITLGISLLFVVVQSNIDKNIDTFVGMARLTDDSITTKQFRDKNYHTEDHILDQQGRNDTNSHHLIRSNYPRYNNVTNTSAVKDQGLIGKIDKNCIESTVQETSYIADSFLTNSLSIYETSEQLIFYINHCGQNQIKQILSQFMDTNDPASSFKLILALYQKAENKHFIIKALKATHIDPIHMEDIVKLAMNESYAIKTALLPSLIKNDDLNNLNKITEYDVLFANTVNRNNEPYTELQAMELTKNLIFSASRNNLQPGTEIYEYLSNTYDDAQSLTFLVKSTHHTNPIDSNTIGVRNENH